MFTFAVVLILFAIVDSFLMNLEKLFTPDELTEMGIRLESATDARVR
jgi:hypothetical protein